MANFEEFKKTVVSYIASQGGADAESISETENFVSAGFLDSVSMIELVLFLEEKFGDIQKDFDFDVIELGTYQGLYSLFEKS